MFVRVGPDEDAQVKVLVGMGRPKRYLIEFSTHGADIEIEDITREQAEALYQALGEHLR